jgi:mannose-6-phosphate isomerase-like protein (cupin superfamily)
VDDVVQLGAVTLRYLYTESGGPYALLEWLAPAGAPRPPVHVHHETDEGFYVLEGTYRFLLDGERVDAAAGDHVLVARGRHHTFWNPGTKPARCLIVLSPPGFEPYFRELSDGLASAESEEAAMSVRQGLSARYDIEVVGPPPDVE